MLVKRLRNAYRGKLFQVFEGWILGREDLEKDEKLQEENVRKNSFDNRQPPSRKLETHVC